MYKYLLFLIIGIILFILLNTKDGFSISGKNEGDDCVDSEDCKVGDDTECGYPNPPSCSCEDDGTGNNICELNPAGVDDAIPPPAIPPFQPPPPVRPTRPPPRRPDRPQIPTRPPPRRPTSPAEVLPVYGGIGDALGLCAAGGGMGGGGMAGGGMAGGGMGGGNSIPPINTLEYDVHPNAMNSLEQHNIGDWCNPNYRNPCREGSCDGHTDDVNGVSYYICAASGGAEPHASVPQVSVTRVHPNVETSPFELVSIDEWCDPEVINCDYGTSCTGQRDEGGIYYYVCE